MFLFIRQCRRLEANATLFMISFFSVLISFEPNIKPRHLTSFVPGTRSVVEGELAQIIMSHILNAIFCYGADASTLPLVKWTGTLFPAFTFSLQRRNHSPRQLAARLWLSEVTIDDLPEQYRTMSSTKSANSLGGLGTSLMNIENKIGESTEPRVTSPLRGGLVERVPFIR